MAKRWIQSLDVELDGSGNPIFALAAPIQADLIDADLYEVTGVPPDNATLYDIRSQLYMLLLDAYSYRSAAEILNSIDSDLSYYLYDGGGSSMPWLARLDYDLHNWLVDWSSYRPAAEILSSIDYDLSYYLYDGGSSMPWLARVDSTLNGMLFDGGSYQPWLQTISNNLLSGAQRTWLADGMYDTDWCYNLAASDLHGQYGPVVGATLHARSDATHVPMLYQSGSPHYALHVKDADGSKVSKTDWAALSAPGQTASYQPTFTACRHVMQVTVATINTNVVVRMEGSVDGSNWYTLGSETTLTANGTYGIQAEGLAPYVRGNFVSESGGTDAQVTFKYHGAR
jgi:hypothetical protein